MRSHGVSNFPDPVLTPSGGYGYRTAGIDPNSAAFQGALQACKGLPSPWNSTGQQLTAAQQQAWLNWAACIRLARRGELPRPDVLGPRSARLGRRVRLAAAAVGDGCLQDAVRRWTGRVTGNGRTVAEQLIASADGAEGNVIKAGDLGWRVP